MVNPIKVMEEVKAKIQMEDKRWPNTYWQIHKELGYRVSKNWIHDLNIWPIVDHTRRLTELKGDLMCDPEFRNEIEEGSSFKERIVVCNPYNYKQEDLDELKIFCEKNYLKLQIRGISPFYRGTKLVIVYEDDADVVRKVEEILRHVDDWYLSQFKQEEVIKWWEEQKIIK